MSRSTCAVRSRRRPAPMWRPRRRRRRCKARLSADPLIVSTDFISKQEAYARNRNFLGADAAKFLTPDDFPDSYVLKLKNVGRDYPTISQNYRSQPGVEVVQNEDESLKTILNIVQLCQDKCICLRGSRAHQCDHSDGDHYSGCRIPAPQRDEHHATGRGIPVDDPIAIRHRGDYRRIGRRRPGGPGSLGRQASCSMASSVTRCSAACCRISSSAKC